MNGETSSDPEVFHNMSSGTHFCQFYESKSDLLEILIPFLEIGLAKNEYCLCVFADQGLLTGDEVRTALARRVPHFERHQLDGDIEFFTEKQWYLKGSQFCSTDVLAALSDKCKRADDLGYSGVRGWGDAFWLSECHWKDFDDYERQVDNLLPGSKVTALCTYPVNKISASKILDVVNTHRFAIARRSGNWEMIETTTGEQSAARLIVDTIPTMAWTIRPDGVVDFVNKRWTEYTGHPAKILEDPLQVIHPDDFPRVMKNWLTNMNVGKTLEDELRLRRFDGEYRWFLVRTAPFTDKHLNIVNWYGVATDIDDSKQLSSALQESEQRYLSLFKNMSEGVAYLRLFFDREELQDGVYLEVNPAWEALTGFSGVVGRRMTEVLPGVLITKSEIISRACRVALTGQPDRFESYSNWLKRWLLVKAFAPKDKHVIIVLDDVTERKEAEEKLRIAYQRLSYQVDNTPLAVIEFDKDLYIRRWSKRAEELFGWTASEALGKNIYDDDFPIVYKEDIQAVDEINMELTRGTVDWNQSYNRNNTKHGTVVSCEWYNSVLRDEQNNVITILSLVLDVTERTKTQTKLQQVNAELHSLSSHLQNVRELERTSIAREIHDELGQQLTGLKIDALWVAKRLEMGDKAVTDKVADMVGLINETMKTVRRISTQLRPGILDDLGLIAALEWQAQEFEKRAAIKSQFRSTQNDVTLDVGLATNIFRVYQEALTNIARHANASRIETVIEVDPKQIKLTIMDDGRGFNAGETPDKTFGLIGMKERALMMGGELTVESEKQRGTTVTLIVPRQADKIEP